MADQQVVVIVGAGAGLSASLARKFSGAGMKVVLAARNTEKLAELAAEVDAVAYACDTADPTSVQGLFKSVGDELGVPEVVVFNASQRVRGEITEIDPEEVRQAVLTTCFGGFLVGQEAAKLMLAAGRGTIMFTGASAGVKGFPKSATFAMGKFGLRGLAQSMARELGPKGIHVAHAIIDGAIDTQFISERFPDRYALKDQDGILQPDDIAESYWQLRDQNRSAWTFELDLRPWMETW